MPIVANNSTINSVLPTIIATVGPELLALSFFFLLSECKNSELGLNPRGSDSYSPMYDLLKILLKSVLNRTLIFKGMPHFHILM